MAYDRTLQAIVRKECDRKMPHSIKHVRLNGIPYVVWLRHVDNPHGEIYSGIWKVEHNGRRLTEGEIAVIETDLIREISQQPRKAQRGRSVGWYRRSQNKSTIGSSPMPPPIWRLAR